MRHIDRIAAAALAVVFLFAMAHIFQPRVGRTLENLGNPHRDATCSDCHALQAQTGRGSLTPAGFRRECENCHTPTEENPTGIPLNFHGLVEKPCTCCHSFHDAQKITAAGQQFIVRFDNCFQRGQCYSCHGPDEDVARLSDGHLAAATIFHSRAGSLSKLSPSQACLICHSKASTVSLGEFSETSRKAPRFGEHGNHPVGIKVVPGKGKPGSRIRKDIEPKITLFADRIECQTCHSLSGGRPSALVDFSSREEFCKGCHQLA